MSPPAALCVDGNLAENWRRWRRSFENYLVAINLIAAPADAAGAFPPANDAIWLRQIAILSHCIGEEAVEILEQFEFDDEADPPESRDKLPDVLAKFEAYFNPRRNKLYEWYVFWSLTQSDGESIDMFVKRLRTQATKCEFGDTKEMMMLCRCAFGIANPKLKEKLLQDPEISLDRAIQLIRAAEVTKAQIQSMSNEKSVSLVADDTKHKRSAPPTPAPRKVSCKYCGYEHFRGKCPAYGQACRKCNQKNHFAKMCMSKDVSAVTKSTAQPNVNDLFIGSIEGENEEETWTKLYTLSHGEKSEVVCFKIDTGAEANVLPLSTAKKLQAVIQPSTAGLTSYTRHRISNVGRTKLNLFHNGVQQGEAWFELVDGSFPPIIGLASSVRLGLVKRVDTLTTEGILEEFPDCFEGIGCLKKEHKIILDAKVTPVVNRARRIPLAMIDKVKAELDKMEASGIISKVDQPTEWVSSLVVVEKKDGSVRICLDPRELNKAIQREHHHIPTLDDIAHRFAGMKIFSIMDMKHGYWHVPLDPESRLLTAFNTPFGRFAFNRLPFGVNSAAEVFEKRVEEIFGDLNVSIYFDDLIIAGKNQEEHDDNLRKLLVRAREYNVKFNREKIQLNRNEVTYLGHIVSADGLKPDPEKVKAITNMPNPTDKHGIQRLLGSLNFLRGFIPNISCVTEPLRVLLKADTVWTWDHEQDAAMDEIKKVLTSTPVLKYFDVKEETTLQVDSSQSGLGAVLLQKGQPVAYASRALTETEQNYPQIDKELLAIVFGCEKFHSYVYGRPIDIQTDHNPLVTIVKKSLHKASPRLQRLLLRLLKYNINRISYVPGKYLYLADTLSRAYIANEAGDIEEDIVMVHTIQVDGEAKDSLLAAYESDPVMKELEDVILEGWHWSSKHRVPEMLRPYWLVRDELHSQDGFIYRGGRLLVPGTLRKEYLRRIHQGHLGTQKCLDRARQTVYWPGISTEVKEMVARCPTCQRFANAQQREPLIPHEVPELPWNKVGMDILEFQSKSFLVVVDFYSHFPELRQLQQKRSTDVIAALKAIFAIHGVPVEVVADNMPFGSLQLADFAKSWGFNVTTSSPHYPRSNGMAERYVQTVKQFLKKANDSGECVYEALLAYRQTPLTGLKFSPAEMLFNRSVRGPLPTISENLQPSIPEALVPLRVRQSRQKEVHDRRAKHLGPLSAGDAVLVRTNKEEEWTPGQVVACHHQPRSYVVDNGTSLVRRNRVHLRPNLNNEESSDDRDKEQQHQQQVSEPGPAQTTPQRSATMLPSTPRRSVRENRGKLPQRFDNYVME